MKKLYDPERRKNLADIGRAISSHYNYWTIFNGVALGCLALFASGKPFTSSRVFKLVVTAGFTLFAGSNLHAILNLNSLRSALADLITDDALRATVSNLRPDSEMSYILFHLGLDLVVVLCIWCVRWQDDSTPRKVTSMV